ncbi:MAG: hypothetical protein HOP15_02725 [Planctomycetes bacterium]|nr:hypothetical protein [Planctomycetota bacterium]
MRSVWLILLSLCTPACAIARTNENEPLDARALHALQPGVSSAADVVAALGAPVDVVQLGRRSAYLYRFTSSKRAALLLLVVGFYNQDTRADRAWVFFDEQQMLTHVGVTLEADESEYAMPWEDLHD